MITGISITLSMSCSWSTSTVSFRVCNSLKVAAVTNVDPMVSSLAIAASQRAGLVLVSHILHDGTQSLVLHCLIETDGLD